MRSLLALLTLVCVLALMVDPAMPDISGWPLIARAAALVGIISLLGALMVCEHKDEQV